MISKKNLTPSSEKKKKNNPLDEILEELEQYDEGCGSHTLGCSGE